MRRLMSVAFAAIVASHAAAVDFADWRLGYTKPGNRGAYDINADKANPALPRDYSFTDAWDATNRFFVDYQQGWKPTAVGLSYGLGLAFEDRRRSPRTDGPGTPNFNNNRPTGFYGPVMKYQTYSVHASVGPYVRLNDWVMVELLGRLGGGLATLGIEYEGVASSATNLFIESAFDLNVIFAEGGDTPFIGLGFGGLSSYSRHYLSTRGETRIYRIYNQDYSGSIFIGYRY